jgi:hypothetical protein
MADTNARTDLEDALLHSFATAAEDPDAEAKRLMADYDAHMLGKYADHLAATYGVTNRAAGELRRLAAAVRSDPGSNR